MDYHKLIEEKRKAAQEVLRKLDESEINAKLQRRTALQNELKELEKELSALFGSDSLFHDGRAEKPRGSRRRSLPDAAKGEKISALLSKHPEGLSAKRIASELEDTYPSVQNYLKKHPELYVRSGEKKSTVYKLNH
jgi:hypothetical protein